MKYIKLFENWAEEIKVPEYLNPNWKPNTNSHEDWNGSNIYTQLEYIKRATYLNLYNESARDKRVNFKSFSDYEFWKKTKYIQIYVQQDNCIYRLEDCHGIPNTDWIHFDSNDIKSLKGLENKILDGFEIENNKIENLKYFPKQVKERTEIHKNKMLLSYYGHPGHKLAEVKNVYGLRTSGDQCGNLCSPNYHSFVKSGRITVNSQILQDVELNAEIFTLFKNEIYTLTGKDSRIFNIKPWHNIYHDPNDVENFEFLFLPFWLASEKFRETAQTHLGDIDLGTNLNKNVVW